MLVAFNVKGDPAHHAIEVGTDNFREAIAAVRGEYKDNFKDLDRCFAVIPGGKVSANVPVLDLTPLQSA